MPTRKEVREEYFIVGNVTLSNILFLMCSKHRSATKALQADPAHRSTSQPTQLEGFAWTLTEVEQLEVVPSLSLLVPIPSLWAWVHLPADWGTAPVPQAERIINFLISSPGSVHPLEAMMNHSQGPGSREK